jgi:hypothetical protein
MLSKSEQDLRNHGQSFHAPEHNYGAMAEDVQEFIQQQKLDKCVLIGHSMYVIIFPMSSPALASKLSVLRAILMLIIGKGAPKLQWQ